MLAEKNNQPNNNELIITSSVDFDQVIVNCKLEQYVLSLYISEKNAKSKQAIQTLTEICEKYLAGRYQLEIIDIAEQPERLEKDQVWAIPTLIKHLPLPLQRLIGDMSNIEKVKILLDV